MIKKYLLLLLTTHNEHISQEQDQQNMTAQPEIQRLCQYTIAHT